MEKHVKMLLLIALKSTFFTVYRPQIYPQSVNHDAMLSVLPVAVYLITTEKRPIVVEHDNLIMTPYVRRCKEMNNVW
jgi:hypothetical protein